MGEVEYFDISLSLVIRQYIKDQLKKKDWEVLAVDPQKDRVVLRRYEL